MSREEQVKAGVEFFRSIIEAIKYATENGMFGGLPSGELYAQLMSSFTLDKYNGLIDTLVGTKLIELKPSHLLVWVGTAEDAKQIGL